MYKNKDEILDIILTKKGIINGYILKKDINIINNIFYLTQYLPNYISIYERIYCLRNEIREIPKCIYCNRLNKVFKEKTSPNYYDFCNNKECKIQNRLEKSTNICLKRWKDHIKEIKIPQSKEERYKQSVITRKKNNPNWFTVEQKEYINKKRLETFNDPIKNQIKISKLKEYWNKPSSKENQSNRIKKLIKDGVFTPPITNTWTHWNSIYYYNKKEYKFRSSWEAAFWSVDKDLEFETLRIPYIYLNKEHTYIVDFIDRKNKIVYEVKPDNKYLKKEKIKEQYLIEWCKKNNYNYKLISNSWFYENYNKIDFTNNEWLLDKMKNFVKL